MRVAAAEAALAGKPLDAAHFARGGGYHRILTAISDIHASADYRLHLAGVLVFRALRDAAARCGSPIQGIYR